MKFIPGEKCFAKVRGFPHWPARINFLPSNVKIPKGRYPIFFYGTYEVCFLPASAILPYEQNKQKFGNPRSATNFNKGIDELENNPTILQYGSDPDAVTFLNQFYTFTIPEKCEQDSINQDSTKNLKQESLDSDLRSESSSSADKVINNRIESQLDTQQLEIKDCNIYKSDYLEEVSHNNENAPPLNVNETIDPKHDVEVDHANDEEVLPTDEYTADFKNLLSDIRKYSWPRIKQTHKKGRFFKKSLDSRIKFFYPWYQFSQKK